MAELSRADDRRRRPDESARPRETRAREPRRRDPGPALPVADRGGGIARGARLASLLPLLRLDPDLAHVPRRPAPLHGRRHPHLELRGESAVARVRASRRAAVRPADRRLHPSAGDRVRRGGARGDVRAAARPRRERRDRPARGGDLRVQRLHDVPPCGGTSLLPRAARPSPPVAGLSTPAAGQRDGVGRRCRAQRDRAVRGLASPVPVAERVPPALRRRGVPRGAPARFPPRLARRLRGERLAREREALAHVLRVRELRAGRDDPGAVAARGALFARGPGPARGHDAPRHPVLVRIRVVGVLLLRGGAGPAGDRRRNGPGEPGARPRGCCPRASSSRSPSISPRCPRGSTSGAACTGCRCGVRSARRRASWWWRSSASGSWRVSRGRLLSAGGRLALPIPPGDTQIVFSCEPPHFRAGLAVSLATVAALAASLASRRVRAGLAAWLRGASPPAAAPG